MPNTLYSEQPYITKVKENFKQNWIYKVYLWIKKWLQKKNLN